MEYTGSAFVQPMTDFFGSALGHKKDFCVPDELFPEKTEVRESVDDAGERIFFRPVFSKFINFAKKTHRLQSGYLHLYILIMVITLIIMLVLGNTCNISVDQLLFGESPDFSDVITAIRGDK
jgi:hypothetical protein